MIPYLIWNSYRQISAVFEVRIELVVYVRDQDVQLSPGFFGLDLLMDPHQLVHYSQALDLPAHTRVAKHVRQISKVAHVSLHSF